MSKKDKKVKAPKKPLTAKQLLTYQGATVGLAILVNILLCVVLIYINRVSSLSKNVFILINCGVVVFLLLVNALVIFLYTRKTKLALKQVMIGVLVVFLALGGYGVYFVSSVFGSVDKVIQTGETENEVREVAFVTYDNNSIKSVNDMNGKTVGVIDSPNFIEGNVLALEEIENQGLKVTLVEYPSYMELIQGLFSDEVDVAALPVDYVKQFEVNEGFPEYLEKTEIIHSFSKTVTLENENKTDIDVTKDPFTILILGVDEARSDAIMVATVNPTNMVMTLTSIPRDSYVPIACYSGKSKDKIAHARYVSRQCSIDTIEELLDIDINFYVEVTFTGVVDIVDALGTIEVYSPATFTGQLSDSRGVYTVWVEEGTHPRTGEQVLAIARERKTAGFDDFVRQQNQQAIIEALIKKVMNMRSPTTAVNVFNAAGENIRTNMSMSQMLDLLSLAINDMDNSTFNNANILTTYGTRLYGYASYSYNHSMQYPLWIYRLYEGSVEDNSNFIKQYLRVDSTPVIPDTFRYNAEWGALEEYFVATYYNEQQVHETMPDFVTSFTGMQLSEVQAWASARGITVNVNKIEQGNSRYSSSYAHNTVIGQNQPYGRLVANITSITVDVIKHPVNCALDEFMSEPECALVPNLIGKTTTDSTYKAFISNFSISPKFNYIMPGDSNYDSSKVGTIASTSPAAGATATSGMSFTVTIYADPNNVVNLSSYVGALKTDFEVVCTANGVTITSTTTTEITTDTTKAGKTYVKSINPTSVMKNGGVVTVVYVAYQQPTVPNIVGSNRNSLPSVPGVTYIGVSETTSDSTLNNIVKSQDVVAGTQVSGSITVNYVYYEYIDPNPGEGG